VKLLFPIIAIALLVVAVYYMFGMNTLYLYGIEQNLNTGDTSTLFSIWSMLSQIPNYFWYGAAVICILIAVIQVFNTSKA
jgi:hypothetical protein